MRKGISIKSLLTMFIAIFLLVSCKSNQSSRTTGWNYNDPENGGFYIADSPEQITGPGLVAIEGGSFTMGSTIDNVYYEWNNTPRKVTVSSFYMDQTEVSNLDYLEYIHWLTRVYKDYPEVISNALPDTLVWRNSLSYNEPMVEIYFRHPAYRDYPVVGVNWKQANDYTLWRSDRVNEKLLIDAGVLTYNNNQTKDYHFSTDAYLAGKYTGAINNDNELREEGSVNPEVDAAEVTETTENVDDNASSSNNEDSNRKIQVEDGILLPKYRLPTEAEWEYAALGLIGNTENENIVERKVYPWESSGLRANHPDYMGTFVANFKRGNGDYMGLAGSLNDGAAFPAPVVSYWPNDFGLFNMAGNVAEWVLDVYRPLSYEDFNDHNPFRGNVYNSDIFSENNQELNDSIRQLREDAYNLNFNDGDFMSTIQEQGSWINASESPEKYTEQMYDYGNTTLISDKSRVYKGGSWADGPYYLSPSVRRFMNEDECSSTVGFRCAMNKVGSALAK